MTGITELSLDELENVSGRDQNDFDRAAAVAIALTGPLGVAAYSIVAGVAGVVSGVKAVHDAVTKPAN